MENGDKQIQLSTIKLYLFDTLLSILLGMLNMNSEKRIEKRQWQWRKQKELIYSFNENPNNENKNQIKYIELNI